MLGRQCLQNTMSFVLCPTAQTNAAKETSRELFACPAGTGFKTLQPFYTGNHLHLHVIALLEQVRFTEKPA